MRKQIKFSDKFPVRAGVRDTFLETLNQRADAHNEFVDITEHRMEWFKTAMDMLLDYLGQKDKSNKRIQWINIWLSIACLIATAGVWAYVLTWN